MISFNQVYTKIRSAVLTASSGANVTATYSLTAKAFPTVFVREIGSFTPQNTVTLATKQCVRESTVETQIYAKKKSDADTLASAITAEMEKQHYVLVTSEPIDNADESLYRFVCRYRRIIGDADTLED